MKYSKALALIAVVFLTLSTSLFAQSSKVEKKHKAATSSIHGSVKSVSDSELVLTQKGKDVTLFLESDTQRVGDIKPGADVVVQYRFDNGKDVASMVKASGAKKSVKGIKGI